MEHGMTSQQKIALKLELVASVEEEFVQWAHKQLVSYVGQGPARATIQQQQQIVAQPSTAYLESMTKVLTEFATSHKTALSEQAKKSE
jgi:ABC-type antimicrobial peptide transport system ATPase subunit